MINKEIGKEVEDIIEYDGNGTPEGFKSFFVKYKNGYSKTYELPEDLITYIKSNGKDNN